MQRIIKIHFIIRNYFFSDFFCYRKGISFRILKIQVPKMVRISPGIDPNYLSLCIYVNYMVTFLYSDIVSMSKYNYRTEASVYCSAARWRSCRL